MQTCINLYWIRTKKGQKVVWSHEENLVLWDTYIRSKIINARSGRGYTKWLKNIWDGVPETQKYWVGVHHDQSNLMGRRCLFSLGWPPFWWWYHNKNTLWGRCFNMSTSFAPHLFLLGWLKLNLTLLLDQLRLA